jgi:hypothetical protein
VGSAVEVHVYGPVPSVAVRVVVYASFTTPTGRLVVVTETVGMTVSVNARVAVMELASVIVNVMLGAPATVGVPVITPAPDKVSPGGRSVDVHVYGPVPPAPTRALVYASPTLPDVRLAVATLTGGTTVIDKTLRAVLEWASVIVNVMPGVPASVGVPEITPAVVMVSPDGRAVELQAYGAVPPAPVREAA